MKKKLMVIILIFAFIFNGCTKATLPITNYNPISNKAFILGSVEYVEKIQTIAKKSGNRSALSVVMVDVNKNGNELDNNTPTNLSRFHKLVSLLIYKIGYVDMDIHYFRNKLNRAPSTLKKLMLLNKTLPINRRWNLLGITVSNFHIQGVDGEYNLKFVSYDSYCEAVYNKNGVLLNEHNDPINMGTYNYGAGIPSIHSHTKFDVDPYVIWGNTANSTQKGKANINKGIYLAVINYKKNAAKVYLYRKNLFGMQQGRVP